jgi:DNA-binding FadR family transcriptional regulator
MTASTEGPRANMSPSTKPGAVAPRAPSYLPKVAQLVAAELRRQIIRGELPEGASLASEANLMEEFGVSRPTLREAFRVLEAESLITVRRGARGGAKVQPPQTEVAARYAGLILQYQGTPLSDVYEVRVLLEAPCVAGLARRHTRADIAALRNALEKADNTGAAGVDETVAAHNDFHTLLISLSGNQTLVMLFALVREIINQANISRAKRDSGTSFAETSRTTHKTHRLLVDLIEDGEAEAAEALWRRHLREAAAYALGGTENATVLDVLP